MEHIEQIGINLLVGGFGQLGNCSRRCPTSSIPEVVGNRSRCCPVSAIPGVAGNQPGVVRYRRQLDVLDGAAGRRKGLERDFFRRHAGRVRLDLGVRGARRTAGLGKALFERDGRAATVVERIHQLRHRGLEPGQKLNVFGLHRRRFAFERMQ